MMKKLLFVLLLGLSSLGFATEDSYLFFQDSSKASITKSNNIPNTYILTLKDPSGYVSYFTDRPERISGVMKLSEFLALWSNKAIKNNFAENPPNVAIVMVTDKGVSQNVVAVVTKPTSSHGVLSYQLRTLNDKMLEVGRLHHISLFFDEINWNSGGF